MIKLYKILSFVLQPLGFMILMMSMSTLVAGLASPQFLIAGAIGVCIFLYTFFSFRFVMKAVIANNPVKASLKDWIKVNSFISLIQAVLILISVVYIFVSPEYFKEALRTTYNMVMSQSVSDTTNLYPFPLFVHYMRITVACMGIFELILTIHILLGWRMLKGYRDYFTE